MEKQTDFENDLLKYLRKWNPRNNEELMERILAHPLEHVRFFWWDMMLFHNEMKKPHDDEEEDLGTLVDNTMYVWNRIKKYEKLRRHHYKDFQEAVDVIFSCRKKSMKMNHV